MTQQTQLHRYDRHQSYEWNYEHSPDPVEFPAPSVPARNPAGPWQFCGLPVASPLGVAAGPLLNGKWCLYYAGLGFDVVTYKTVRSRQRECYPLPNLVPVATPPLQGGESSVSAADQMRGSWAVSFGMPSKSPAIWRADISKTREQLAPGKLLSVSVVASVEDGWTVDDLADDYARCAKWAVESGADVVEANFSCPNVSTCDGQLFQRPDDARIVAQRVREAVGGVPMVIKIGHIREREAASQLIESLAPAASALAMTNSIATTVYQQNGLPHFDGQVRGVCGQATLAASIQQVAMFHELCSSLDAPLELIGVGGASTAKDVRGYLDAGAHAVHLATAAMVDPGVALKIKDQWN